jgi:hypothetical protein
MSKLKFSDGEEFDVSGALRIEHRKDGYYVVGDGILYPADSKEDAEKYIGGKREVVEVS